MPWYPKKSNKEGFMVCPVCEGTRTVVDAKTEGLRDCVLCAGVGSLPEKGNARVVPMSQEQLKSIINATKLTSK